MSTAIQRTPDHRPTPEPTPDVRRATPPRDVDRRAVVLALLLSADAALARAADACRLDEVPPEHAER